jgi:hypothetical protein
MILQEIWNAAAPWLQLLSVVGAVVQCLGVWALWSLTRKFVPREECEACHAALAERLQRQEASAGELKCAVSSAPTKDEVVAMDKGYGALRAEIEGLTAMVQAQAAAMRGLTHQVNLLIQHHLERRP